MLKNSQVNQFTKLLAAILAFLVCGLAAYPANATPELDAMVDYWHDQYLGKNPYVFYVENEPFHWDQDGYATPEEAKQAQVGAQLAHGNIVNGTKVVTNLTDPENPEYIIYEEGPEYDVTEGSGIIYIDKDEPRMEVGPTYYISYYYKTTPEFTPLLDNPGLDDPGFFLDKAKVDQCYNGGYHYDGGYVFDASTYTELLDVPGECPDEGMPSGEVYPFTKTVGKTNQAYVWSMFMDNDNHMLWFGTVANTSCLVAAATFGLDPFSTNEFACEYGASLYGSERTPPLELDAAAGDWRPPHIYYYDTAGADPPDVDPPVDVTPDDPLIDNTMGIRAAGAVDGVAILGGPSLDAIGGGSLSAGLEGEVNLFAFDSATGAFIESYAYDTYNDIRKWVVVNGVLYTSMKSTADGSGHILRWCGNVDEPFAACGGAGDPPGFMIVGIIPNGMGAYLAEHEGRIFLTTWPALELDQGSGLPNEDRRAGLFMSPVIPANGLTATHQNSWAKVWDVGEYEKDYITSFTYGGGALASLNGYLYWGTIHVLNIANLAALAANESSTYINLDTDGSGSIDGDENDVIALGTFRPLSLFRGRNFGQADQVVELLYGMDYMPVYCTSLLDCADILDPTDNNPNYPSYTVAEDAYHRNNMNQDPLWGPAGVLDSANVYTWSMEVYKNRLYIGTFDSSDLSPDTALGVNYEAADLYRVDCDQSRPKIENLSGYGNIENYGIRNMVTDGRYLYLGTANPQSLDQIDPGGWELLRLGENADAGICGYDCEPMPGIKLSFDQVAIGGGCSAVVTAGSEPPDNYNFLGQTYEITASGDFGGPLEICFEYNEAALTVAESRVAVMHRQDAGSPWEDITTSKNAQENIVCGRADSLSEFTLGEDNRPRGGGGGGGGCFISSAASSFLGL